MATDERYIASLRDDLLAVLEEAGKEDPHPTPISFPNDEWNIFSYDSLDIIYRRPETATAIRKLLGKVFGRKDWTRKWSSDYIEHAFAKALGVLGDRSPEAIHAAFSNMAQALDEEPKARRVVTAVGGVALLEDELRIGSIRLFKMNDSERERLRNIFHTVVDTLLVSDEIKAQERQRADQFLQLYGNLTAAEIPTVGDVKGAQQSAVRISEPVLEFLQLIAAIEEPEFKKIRIVGGGDLMARQPPRLVISADGTEVNWHFDLNFGHRLELTAERVAKVVSRFDLQPAVDAMSRPEAERNEYEQMLLNAIHWIADGEKQERLENRITSYTTAMELFFTAEDAPITRDLSESVAYLFGKDLEQRKHVKRLVARLYKARNKVSHEGRRGALEQDVRELKNLTVNVLAAMSGMADRFTSKSDLQAFFADLRLSATFDPSQRQSQEATPPAQA